MFLLLRWALSLRRSTHLCCCDQSVASKRLARGQPSLQRVPMRPCRYTADEPLSDDDDMLRAFWSDEGRRRTLHVCLHARARRTSRAYTACSLCLCGCRL